MREWVFKKLKVLGTFRSNGADKLSQPGEIPVRLVNYMDVYRCERITSRIEFQEVTAKEREIARCDLKRGDVLFTPSSETPDDIGRASVVTEDLPGAVYSYHVVRFRLHDPASFDTDFLAYAFNQASARNHFSARATGITRYTLNRSDFTSLELHLSDDIAEQKGIAASLQLVDKHITATQAAISAAERLQRGLMRELLAGRIRPDGSVRAAADFWSHDRLGHVPHRWEVRHLRELIRLKNGKSNITSNLRSNCEGDYQYPVFGGNGMTGWSDRFFLPEPTVVVGRVGEYCGAIHATPQEAWVTDNALYVEERLAPLDVRFLFHLLTSLRLNRWKATTGQPKITQSEILNIRVAFPEDEDEQRAIADRLDAFHDLIRAKESKILALQRLKKSLMQNLLTGRMRLPAETIAALNAQATSPATP